MRRPSPAALLPLLPLLGGCPHRTPPVEFHSDAGAAVIAARDGRTVARSDASQDVAPGASPFAAIDGRPVGGDGQTLAFAGATLAAPAGERFAAWLPADLDGDGAATDLVLTRLRTDGGAAGAGVYRRAGAGFEPVALSGGGPPDVRCADTGLRQTSPRSVVVTYRCGTVEGGVALPVSVEAVLLALGPQPAERYRASLLRPDLPDTALDLRLEGIDRDGDGQDDVVATLAAGRPSVLPGVPPGGPAATAVARVVYFARGDAFARDTSEPAASLGAAVEVARRALARRRAGAPLAVEGVGDLVRLRRALCAEGGAARLRLGGVVGADCGAPPAFEAGAEVLARAWLALGELPAALALTRPETASELGVASGARLQADLQRVATPEPNVTARPGPFAGQDLDPLGPARTGVLVIEAPAGSAPPVAVQLRGPVTGRIDLGAMAFTPGPPGAARDVLPRAPDGATIVGFAETCRGVAAVLCPSIAPGCGDAALAPGAPALPVGSTLLRLSALPSAALAARCLQDPGALAVPGAAAGARVIGWGRDGVVLEWRARLYRVAATGAGGDATAVGTGDPLGSEFAPGGAVSRSGAVAVEAGAEGVWVRVRGQWHLWAPAALAGRYQQLADLTVTDDGRLVVGMLGPQVWALERPRAGASPGR